MAPARLPSCAVSVGQCRTMVARRSRLGLDLQADSAGNEDWIMAAGIEPTEV